MTKGSDIILEILLKDTNEAFNADVHAKNRLHKNCFARYAFMYILRTKYKFTFQKISDYLQMNHASILHGCKQHEILFKYDNNYKINYNKITKSKKESRWLCVETKFELKKIQL